MQIFQSSLCCLTENMSEKKIRSYWENIDIPAAFSNVQYFTKTLRSLGLHTNIKKVQHALEKNSFFQTSRNIRRNFKRRHDLAFYFSQRWESDVGMYECCI